MPTNASIEYSLAEQEYQKAETTKDKIKALRKMLSTAPTHKGAEKLRANIRKRIAKYKELSQKESKSGKRRTISIRKEGAGQIVFVGVPNSGKSTLLSKLSKKEVEIAEYPFTTKEPTQRMIPFENIKLQGIEIPGIYDGFFESDTGRQFFGIIRHSDLIVIVLNYEQELEILNKEFSRANIILTNNEKNHENFTDYLPYLKVSRGKFEDPNLSELLWKKLNKIRVQTKSDGKIAKKPIILSKGANIEAVAKKIHKDFLRKFKYARVWGPSSKFDGQQVGLKHEVKDTDIIEIFIN